MEHARFAGRLAQTGGGTGGVHAARVPAKQRLHLAALLILIALPLQAQIDFDPATTQQEFATFSRIVGQSIYATPVDPARATGILGFDVGIAASGVKVDTGSRYWQLATDNDVTIGDYLAVPRLVVRKGISAATVSASYAEVPDLDVKVWGAALDVPIIDGGLIKPTLAVRGVYSTIRGADVFDGKSYGAEVFLSKGFGPVTPYGAIGRMRVTGDGVIPASGARPEIHFSDQADMNRVTVGARLSLLIPKLVFEVTQADERVYSAKISFGL